MSGTIIPSFSGGKDSTYLVLRMHELGIKMSDIVYFDTGWEFQAMAEHKTLVEDFIKQKITVLHPRIPFNDLFSKKSKRDALGSGYGFARFNLRWCTGEKIKGMTSYAKSLSWKGFPLPITQCIGYAADEQKRVEKHKANKTPQFLAYKYPLVDENITEIEALEYCKDRGFNWRGLYNIFDRVSCWCCPLQGISGARKIYLKFPNLWEKLLEMENQLDKNHVGRFFTGKNTVSDLDKRFHEEKKVV